MDLVTDMVYLWSTLCLSVWLHYLVTAGQKLTNSSYNLH